MEKGLGHFLIISSIGLVFSIKPISSSISLGKFFVNIPNFDKNVGKNFKIELNQLLKH